MKKILVFGAGGFVGPYLIKELSCHGYQVIQSDLYKDKILLDFPFIQCDITSNDSVFETIKNVNPDFVINLAAISSVSASWRNPQLTFSINVIGTINVLSAVAKINPNCKTMIIGSSEEYKASNKPLTEKSPLDSNNPYGISKETQEKIARIYASKYNMKVIFTRSFNHTGIGQNENFVIPSFCKQAIIIEREKLFGKILVGNLSPIRDFSDVRDIVAAYRFLLENKNEGTFNVGSGNPISIKQILDKIINKSKAKIEVVLDQSKFRSIDTPFICCSKNEISRSFNHNIDDTLDWMMDYYRGKQLYFPCNYLSFFVLPNKWWLFLCLKSSQVSS